MPELGCTNPLSENYDSTANVLVANGGAVDNLTYGVGGFHTNDEFDMVFNCVEDVTINSVDVYAQTSFVVEIEILDVNDVQIFSSNFFLNEGLNTLSLDYDIVAVTITKLVIGIIKACTETMMWIQVFFLSIFWIISVLLPILPQTLKVIFIISTIGNSQ